VFYSMIARIRDKTGARRPSGTAARLRQLDQEIGQEEALQVGAAVLGFVGAILGFTVSSAFALLPAMVFATLGQYAIQGWCPPMLLLKRLGLRRRGEIERERYAVAATLEEPPLLAVAGGADD
jgi:hypothetical protein